MIHKPNTLSRLELPLNCGDCFLETQDCIRGLGYILDDVNQKQGRIIATKISYLGVGECNFFYPIYFTAIADQVTLIEIGAECKLSPIAVKAKDQYREQFFNAIISHLKSKSITAVQLAGAADELTKLVELYKSGALTEEEFSAAKKKAIG